MKSKIIRIMIGAIIGSFLMTMAFAHEFPEPVGYVNDFADVLTVGEERSLEAILKNYEEKSTIEIVIVTITSLDGPSIEEYTNLLAEKWGVGKETKNNGLVILNSIGDRKWRIEIGYGLKEYMTDEYSRNIGDNYLTPNLKKGKYFDAYKQTVEQIIKRFGNLTEDDVQRMKDEDGSDTLLIWIIIIAVVIIIIIGIVDVRYNGGALGGY